MNEEVSILIPTRNRPGALRQCLQAICEWPTAPHEIIVCDDGDDNRSQELLRADFPQVQWLRGPGRGPGANRNAAVKVASGDWLVFIDDDCIPQQGYCDALKRSIAALAPNAKPVVFSGCTLATGGVAGSLLWEAPGYNGRGLPPSCNFAIRLDTFLASGGFDERFRVSFEDIEFFARLEASGVLIQHIPSMVVEHPRRRIPGPGHLAARWESRVVSTLDFGAPPWKVSPLVLRHCTAVIVSRFRENPLRWDTPLALLYFFAEWLHVLLHLPVWVIKWSAVPRSAFWTARAASGEIPPRYGL